MAAAAVAFFCTPLIAPPLVSADLGAAETGQSNSSHEVFCSKKGNKCTVKFTEDRMIVGNGKGIRRDQIIRVWSDQELRGF